MECFGQNVAQQESEVCLFLYVKNVCIFAFKMFSCVCTNLIFNHIHYSVRMNNVIRTLHLLNFLT